VIDQPRPGATADLIGGRERLSPDSGDPDMGQSSDRSVVDGSLIGRLGVRTAAAAITVATLGFGFPVGLVLVRRSQARHTTLDGRQVEFTGSAGELFRVWLLWWTLTLATLGVYGVWVVPRVARWTRKHTRVAPSPAWEYDVTPAEPFRLAGPIGLSLAFFPEAGTRQLFG
jgi:uncharacterized membrane protein YjgN (DUF898 family)